MSKKLITTIYVFVLIIGLPFSQAFGDGEHIEHHEKNQCNDIMQDKNSFSVCKFNLTRDRLELFLKDDNGEPVGTFTNLEDILAGSDEELIFAINAGMYDADLFPVGYFVLDGQLLKKANTNDGPGNFHLKPNGIFYIDEDSHGNQIVGVKETQDFLASGIEPVYATQSGPMLLIDGGVHPAFRVNSTSRKKRNGVGVSDDGKTVWFAISNGRVTFHEFASLFKDRYGVSNALFLDGTISKLYAKDLDRHDKGLPMGPIIGLSQPKSAKD